MLYLRNPSLTSSHEGFFPMFSCFIVLHFTLRSMIYFKLIVSSVAQSCPTLCDPRDCSMPGLPVHHQLLEFIQTHTHRWCHPTISSSVVPFSSCLQSFPASGSFQMSQLFTSGGQSIALPAPTSVPSNEHPGLISFRMDCLENRLRSSHSSGRAAAAAAILHGGNS